MSIPVPISGSLYGNGDPFVLNPCMETVSIVSIWGSPNPYGDSRMEINNTSKVTTMLPFNKWLNAIHCYLSCRAPAKLSPPLPSWPPPPPPRCHRRAAAAYAAAATLSPTCRRCRQAGRPLCAAATLQPPPSPLFPSSSPLLSSLPFSLPMPPLLLVDC